MAFRERQMTFQQERAKQAEAIERERLEQNQQQIDMGAATLNAEDLAALADERRARAESMRQDIVGSPEMQSLIRQGEEAKARAGLMTEVGAKERLLRGTMARDRAKATADLTKDLTVAKEKSELKKEEIRLAASLKTPPKEKAQSRSQQIREIRSTQFFNGFDLKEIESHPRQRVVEEMLDEMERYNTANPGAPIDFETMLADRIAEKTYTVIADGFTGRVVHKVRQELSQAAGQELPFSLVTDLPRYRAEAVSPISGSTYPEALVSFNDIVEQAVRKHKTVRKSALEVERIIEQLEGEGSFGRLVPQSQVLPLIR